MMVARRDLRIPMPATKISKGCLRSLTITILEAWSMANRAGKLIRKAKLISVEGDPTCLHGSHASKSY